MKYFFSLIFFLFLPLTSSAMTLDAFQALDVSASSFGGLFHAYAPITYHGISLWDYVITPSSGASDYSVVLYTGDGYWVSGDGSSHVYFTTSTHNNYSPHEYGVTYTHFVAGGFGGNSPLTSPMSSVLGDAFVTDFPLYTSQPLFFLDSCSDAFLSANPVTPDLYRSCGSWVPDCTPVATNTSSCTPVVPPTTTISCGFDLSSVPPWTDPLGMFSGFFSALFSWFTCAFNGLITAFSGTFISLIVPSDTFFSSSFDSINSLFDTKFAFYSQITSAFTVPSDSSMAPISLGSLHIGTTTTAPIAFISSFNASTFAPFRNFLSMVMYVSLGFWLIRKTSTIFSS